MKHVRESQVESEGRKYEVVEFHAGDTIPVDAIKIDGEWHVPKAEKADPEPEKPENIHEEEDAVKPKKRKRKPAEGDADETVQP